MNHNFSTATPASYGLYLLQEQLLPVKFTLPLTSMVPILLRQCLKYKRMVSWGKKICTQVGTMGKTVSICLYPPPSAFPQPCLSFPRLPEGGAEQPMKLHLQLMGQSDIITVRGTSCLEITMVVYQGTKTSYLPSVIQDPTEICWTVTHGSREKSSQSSYNWGPLPKKPRSPELFCFTAPSNKYSVKNWGREKKFRKQYYRDVEKFSSLCPVWFQIHPKKTSPLSLFLQLRVPVSIN